MKLECNKPTAVLLMAFFIIAPASAIMNVDIQSNGGYVHKEIAAGEETAYSGETVIGEEAIMDSWDASGSDKKSIKSTVGSGSNAQTISLESSGPMDASVTSFAAPDAVVSCFDGEMDGDLALLKLASRSKSNDQYLTAGFSGDVSEDDEGLDASLTMVSAGGSGIDGDISVLGVDAIGGGVQGDTEMMLNGLYARADGGLGEFGATLLNVDKSGDNKGEKLYGTIRPGIYENSNDPTAYVLAGWLWSDGDLGLGKTKLYLLNDRALSDECKQSGSGGLTVSSANSAIAASANRWDDAAAKNIFPETNAVTTLASGIRADRYDGKNVHAWTSMSGALAYSRTWTTTATVKGVDGNSYKRAIESDVCYNKNLRWTTNNQDPRLYHWDSATQNYIGDTFYLETVATHELGHTFGLGDTYLHSTYQYDLSQIMGKYNDINDLNGDSNIDADTLADEEVHLGDGDKNGIQKLYGKPA